jgi:hypothetical protein
MTGGLVLFYAGAVIQDANGFTFSLCVIDTNLRTLSDEQKMN